MPLDEFMFLLTAGTTIIAIGLLIAAAVLAKKYGNRVLITPVAFIVIMIAVGVFVCLKVNNGKMTVEAEFYDSVSSSFFEDGRYHTVTIDYENKNIKRKTWYGSQTLNVTVKEQKSNTSSSIVRTRRSWGALYNEEIELQVSQDEYDNQIFKK
jgi:energy-coupling factor transporter transmembrane protein EcfT